MRQESAYRPGPRVSWISSPHQSVMLLFRAIAVRAEICGSGKNDQMFDVVDEDDNSTVWDDPFQTDVKTCQEFERPLEEGIEAMIGLCYRRPFYST